MPNPNELLEILGDDGAVVGDDPWLCFRVQFLPSKMTSMSASVIAGAVQLTMYRLQRPECCTDSRTSADVMYDTSMCSVDAPPAVSNPCLLRRLAFHFDNSPPAQHSQTLVGLTAQVGIQHLTSAAIASSGSSDEPDDGLLSNPPARNPGTSVCARSPCRSVPASHRTCW